MQNPGSPSNEQRVADYWSQSQHDYTDVEKNFYCFPPLRSRHCQLIFGEADASRPDWCEYWTVEKILKPYLPFQKCLSICCGFGEIERRLARMKVAARIVGTDIAPGAVAEAEKRGLAEGFTNLEYFVADLNQTSLPLEEYDLIWANGALHHIEHHHDPCVAKVTVVIDGHAADVHANLVRFDGGEYLFFAFQRVVDL